MKITPTLLTAALAGAFTGFVMSILWPKLIDDSTSLVVAFLFFVAFPAHAFVVGFTRSQPVKPGVLDIALLKRVGAWLGTAAVTMMISQAANA